MGPSGCQDTKQTPLVQISALHTNNAKVKQAQVVSKKKHTKKTEGSQYCSGKSYHLIRACDIFIGSRFFKQETNFADSKMVVSCTRRNRN